MCLQFFRDDNQERDIGAFTNPPPNWSLQSFAGFKSGSGFRVW